VRAAEQQQRPALKRRQIELFEIREKENI